MLGIISENRAMIGEILKRQSKAKIYEDLIELLDNHFSGREALDLSVKKAAILNELRGLSSTQAAVSLFLLC